MIIDSVEDGDTVDAKHCSLTREGTAPCELPYVYLHRIAIARTAFYERLLERGICYPETEFCHRQCFI